MNVEELMDQVIHIDESAYPRSSCRDGAMHSRDREWYDHLSMNKLSNMLTGIIQGSKLFSTNRRYGRPWMPD